MTNCKFCNKEFESRIGRNKVEVKYCSSTCRRYENTLNCISNLKQTMRKKYVEKTGQQANSGQV